MMTLKKISLVGALLVAGLALSSCSASDAPPKPDTDSTSQVGSVTNGVPDTQGAAKYTYSDIEKEPTLLEGVTNAAAADARFYMDAPDFRDKLIASSVADYLDSTIYNPYFVADWWAEKDDYGKKGLKNVAPVVSDPLLKVYEEKSETDEGREELATKGYLFLEPAALKEEGITANPPCFDNWDEYACFAPDKQEKITILSKSLGGIKVGVVTKFRVYVADPSGSTATQDVTYKALLTLTENNRLTDLKEQPFHVVKSIEEGEMTYSNVESPKE